MHELLVKTPEQSANQVSSVARLQLQFFRNYAALDVRVESAPVILFGENGSGKTNILEALSLFSPGKGLRHARLRDMDQVGQDGTQRPWSASMVMVQDYGQAILGTGRDATADADKRLLRVDGEPAKFTELSEYVTLTWLTPAIEQLFLGSGSDRRAYVDRLTAQFYPDHSRTVYRYEHAVRERNKLLFNSMQDVAWYAAVEHKIAELGVAIAVARNEVLHLLNQSMQRGQDVFPAASVWMEGEVEQWAREMSALDAEAACREKLEHNRATDREVGRTSIGVHKSELQAVHSVKNRPARLCSTGEQKAIMLSLTMAFVRAQAVWRGTPPLLLLDEVVAHLDAERREALFEEIQSLHVQAWMTGTEAQTFESMQGVMQGFIVKDGALTRAW